MSNDTYVQAWTSLSADAFLEAASVAPFNAAGGGDVLASVLFKIPGLAFPTGDDNFNNLPWHLWGNVDGGPGTEGWALELIDDDGIGGTGLSLCARVGGGVGKAIFPLASTVAATANGLASLADRLILASLHWRAEDNVLDLYINGNRVARSANADALVDATAAPRVGLSPSGTNGAGNIEIVGVGFKRIPANQSQFVPQFAAAGFRESRQDLALGLISNSIATAPSLVTDYDHRYNAKPGTQSASLGKGTNPNPPQGTYGYNAPNPLAQSPTPDVGNAGGSAIAGVSPVLLNVVLNEAGAVFVLTTRDPDWFQGGAPLVIESPA